MRQLTLVLITALLVTACGAKGPLYLPDRKYPQPKDPSQTEDTSQPDSTPLPQDGPQPQDTRQ
jgi:predicted small lipoprotein YifL